VPPRPQPTPASEAAPVPVDKGPSGPVPEANRPGHHPEVEQDKPTGPPGG
jgi:hypothetical protein